MNTTSRTTEAVTSRLKIGSAILAAAEVVDSNPIAARLTAFAAAHRVLTDAERKVDEAEAKLEAEKLRLAQRGADHDEAVESLARRLVNDGQPRPDPFGAFVATTPSEIKRMAPAEAARAVRGLIAAIRRGTHLSSATLAAVQHLEEVTQQVEAAVVPVEQLSGEVRAARQPAEVVARTWQKTLSALRRGARAAGDDGAPDLYGALFKSGVLAKRPKAARPVPADPTPTAVPATPAAS
jgi:hypothetical protein